MFIVCTGAITAKASTAIARNHVIGKRGHLADVVRSIVVIRRTSRSLYERANGYNCEAVKIFMPAGSKQTVVVHYVEHMPPDVTAGIFWLKNRDPENWRDVQNVNHVQGKYIIADRPMSEEEWAKERATVIDASRLLVATC
jgi:hypothetical protein